MKITPFDTSLGARVTELDLSTLLDGQTFYQLHTAWLKHSVLIIPGQSLIEDALVEFSNRLRPLELLELLFCEKQQHGKRKP